MTAEKPKKNFTHRTEQFISITEKVKNIIEKKDQLVEKAEKKLKKFAKNITEDIMLLRAYAQDIKVPNNTNINVLEFSSDGRTSIQCGDKKLAELNKGIGNEAYANEKFSAKFNELKEKIKERFGDRLDFKLELSDLREKQSRDPDSHCTTLEIFDKALKKEGSNYVTPLFSMEWSKVGLMHSHALLHVNYKVTNELDADSIAEYEILKAKGDNTRGH